MNLVHCTIHFSTIQANTKHSPTFLSFSINPQMEVEPSFATHTLDTSAQWATPMAER